MQEFGDAATIVTPVNAIRAPPKSPTGIRSHRADSAPILIGYPTKSAQSMLLGHIRPECSCTRNPIIQFLMAVRGSVECPLLPAKAAK